MSQLIEVKALLLKPWPFSWRQGAAVKDLQAFGLRIEPLSCAERISGDGGDHADDGDVDVVVDGMVRMMQVKMTTITKQ